jgi:hypothetical protein
VKLGSPAVQGVRRAFPIFPTKLGREFPEVAKTTGPSNGRSRFSAGCEAWHTVGSFQAAVPEKALRRHTQVFLKARLQMAKRDAKGGGDIAHAQRLACTFADELAGAPHQTSAGIADPALTLSMEIACRLQP